MADTAAEVEQKAVFLSGLVMAFKEQMHTDILLKPGDDGPAIPAHKAVLAARSNVFRNMLDSDECKASTNNPITLPELNTEELNSLIEFLYSGTLNAAYKHIRSLYLAADKYDISYLQECCRNHFLTTMSSSNVLDILELSDIPSDKTLKDTALNFIVRHMEEVVLPIKYESFARRNPDLGVQITRAFLIDTKAKDKVREAVLAQFPLLFDRGL